MAANPKTPGRAWSELATESLERAGLRSGGARAKIVDRLASQQCCRSAQEIHSHLRSSGESVGIASVYRALEALEGLGLVQRTDLGDGVGMYEAVVPGGEHHHHIVCDRCERVTPFEDETLEKTIHDLARERRHTPTAHEIVIRGICTDCSR